MLSYFTTSFASVNLREKQLGILQSDYQAKDTQHFVSHIHADAALGLRII